MPNCKVDPPIDCIDNEIAVYHAQPHGNRDGMNKLITPDIFINISEVMTEKRNMLAEHKSQKEWLDRSQGFNAYLDIMKEYGQEVGKMSKHWEYAEGWRQHNPLGLCAANSDPMKEFLKEYYFRGK